MSFLRPIYELHERGNYSPNYIPRGRSTNIPGQPNYNPGGFTPMHFNFFTIAGISVRVLEQDSKRSFLQIQNMSTVNDIIYTFGKSASLIDGITLSPGQVEIFDVKVPTEFMEIFSVGGAQRVHIVLGI